jgi:hypothetical protein
MLFFPCYVVVMDIVLNCKLYQSEYYLFNSKLWTWFYNWLLSIIFIVQCSMIWQTYISNNERIVHLKPRPPIYKSKVGDQCPESKSKENNLSARFKSGGSTCEQCGKHLQDERSRFCSIICKVTCMLLF